MQLPRPTQELLNVFVEKRVKKRKTRLRDASAAVSRLAVLYEKARNAVEFRADHLVRRAAIERILKRLLLTSKDKNTIAENLTLELLWSRYIDSSLIDDNATKVVASIIDRYLLLKTVFDSTNKSDTKISWDDLLGIAATEIDGYLFPNKKEEALIKYFYLAIRPKIKFHGHDEEMLDMCVYVALRRAYSQAEDSVILTSLLKMSFPRWFESSSKESTKIAPVVIQASSFFKSNFNNPLVNDIQKYMRSQMPPFLLLRDFLFEHKKDARSIIEDKDFFDEELKETAQTRYEQIGSKVRTAIVRSFIYIFLTKMIFALAIEVPFDLYVAKSFSSSPLIINSLFPPLLLVFIAGLFKVPGKENTERLVEKTKKVVYQFDDFQKEKDIPPLDKKDKRSRLSPVFSFLYLTTFILTFVAINYVLTLLHFSIASKAVFIFFVALVSFFAYRIRLSAQEYNVVETEGFMVSILDYIFLPVIRAGQTLSIGIAKLNVLTYFFDFILEAPLKTILAVIEEWLRFIRAKKEEIL